jgi:hypothetical protein
MDSPRCKFPVDLPDHAPSTSLTIKSGSLCFSTLVNVSPRQATRSQVLAELQECDSGDGTLPVPPAAFKAWQTYIEDGKVPNDFAEKVQLWQVCRSSRQLPGHLRHPTQTSSHQADRTN